MVEMLSPPQPRGGRDCTAVCDGRRLTYRILRTLKWNPEHDHSIVIDLSELMVFIHSLRTADLKIAIIQTPICVKVF